MRGRESSNNGRQPIIGDNAIDARNVGVGDWISVHDCKRPLFLSWER